MTAGYAGGRLVLESPREQDSGSVRFTVYHALSLAMIVVSLATLTARWPK